MECHGPQEAAKGSAINRQSKRSLLSLAEIAAGSAILCAFWGAGEIVSHLTARFLPGPIAGMLLLVVALQLPFSAPLLRLIEKPAQFLLTILPLLLVPIAAELLVSYQLLAEHWLAVALSLVIGWLVSFVVTAVVAHLLWRGRETPHD